MDAFLVLSEQYGIKTADNQPSSEYIEFVVTKGLWMDPEGVVYTLKVRFLLRCAKDFARGTAIPVLRTLDYKLNAGFTELILYGYALYFDGNKEASLPREMKFKKGLEMLSSLEQGNTDPRLWNISEWNGLY